MMIYVDERKHQAIHCSMMSGFRWRKHCENSLFLNKTIFQVK